MSQIYQIFTNQNVGNIAGNIVNSSDYTANADLVQVAQDIQQLLEQLSETYPTTTTSEKVLLAAKAIEEIEKNPTLKERLSIALQAVGSNALRELIDDSTIVNIVLSSLED
jgi:hypothetical protein